MNIYTCYSKIGSLKEQLVNFQSLTGSSFEPRLYVARKLTNKLQEVSKKLALKSVISQATIFSVPRQSDNNSIINKEETSQVSFASSSSISPVK